MTWDMPKLTLDIDPKTYAFLMSIDAQGQAEIETLARAAIRRELFRRSRRKPAPLPQPQAVATG